MKTLDTLLALAWPLCLSAAAAAAATPATTRSPPTMPLALLQPSPALAAPLAALRQPPWMASLVATTSPPASRGTPSRRREGQALPGGGEGGRVAGGRLCRRRPRPAPRTDTEDRAMNAKDLGGLRVARATAAGVP